MHVPLVIFNFLALKVSTVLRSTVLRSFFFMGAKVYNDLPAEIRKTENHQNFIKL
jgi:hypothetical protein